MNSPKLGTWSAIRLHGNLYLYTPSRVCIGVHLPTLMLMSRLLAG